MQNKRCLEFQTAAERMNVIQKVDRSLLGIFVTIGYFLVLTTAGCNKTRKDLHYYYANEAANSFYCTSSK
jgi:hypothetical protein